MKGNFLRLLAVLLFAGYAARAQENAPQPELDSFRQQELHLNDDKTLIFEPDAKPRLRDSVAVKSTPKKAGTKKEAHEDALNVNFLYFIIQKFKANDLLDL